MAAKHENTDVFEKSIKHSNVKPELCNQPPNQPSAVHTQELSRHTSVYFDYGILEFSICTI